MTLQTNDNMIPDMSLNWGKKKGETVICFHIPSVVAPKYPASLQK